jgi:hypothetical protein
MFYCKGSVEFKVGLTANRSQYGIKKFEDPDFPVHKFEFTEDYNMYIYVLLQKLIRSPHTSLTMQKFPALHATLNGMLLFRGLWEYFPENISRCEKICPEAD